jgi:hypothetical protein
MATVINNPTSTPGDGSSSAVGIVVGILVAVVVAVLFFVYGLPAITGNEADRGDDTRIEVDIDRNAAPPRAPEPSQPASEPAPNQPSELAPAQPSEPAPDNSGNN